MGRCWDRAHRGTRQGNKETREIEWLKKNKKQSKLLNPVCPSCHLVQIYTACFCCCCFCFFAFLIIRFDGATTFSLLTPLISGLCPNSSLLPRDLLKYAKDLDKNLKKFRISLVRLQYFFNAVATLQVLHQY